MEKLVVGSKVRLLKSTMWERVYSIGYVVDTKENSISVVFQDGSYDSFTEDEQDSYLENLGVDPRYSTYKFTPSASKLMKDYRDGYWKFE